MSMEHRLRLRKGFMEERHYFGELFPESGLSVAAYTEYLEDMVEAQRQLALLRTQRESAGGA